MATLVEGAHRSEAINHTQREIDLAYGLKDKQVSIFTHIIQLFFIILVCIM